MIKKLITIVITIMLFTSVASAQTMYLKDESWSYTDKRILPNFVMSIYGKGEAVEVISMKTVQKTAWVPSLRSYLYLDKTQKVCMVEKNGVKVYIPRSKLTTKKPQSTYKIKNCYRKLTIKKDTKIYDSATFKSNKRVLEKDLTVYTIGQTNYWYQFYYEGNVYFIKKNSSNIISNEKSTFPLIILDGVPKKCLDRVKYQYSLLPQELRDDISISSITISNWKDKDNKLAGYTYIVSKEIYLREQSKNRFEYSMFHEIGHLYKWKHNVFSELALNERDNLELSNYLYQFDEYFAEGLNLYIKQYSLLKEKAPNLVKYYEEAY